MSRQGFRVGKVTGTKEVAAALDDMPADLYAEICDMMKSEADAVAGGIDSAMPGSAPLSGFEHGGRTSWGNRGSARTYRESSRVAGNAREWPVYRIALGGYSSAVTDIAGAGSGGKTLQGQAMISALNARSRSASRWVWPVAKAHEPRIQARMEAAADKVGRQITAELAE